MLYPNSWDFARFEAVFHDESDSASESVHQNRDKVISGAYRRQAVEYGELSGCDRHLRPRLGIGQVNRYCC
jgi:hypothetical protein